MSGRPKKNRKMGKDEVLKHKRSANVRSKGRGEFGHNIRTCEGPVGSTSKKKTTNEKDVSIIRLLAAHNQLPNERKLKFHQQSSSWRLIKCCCRSKFPTS
ncbi:hypothetical protein ACOSQ2_013100 [Xanthoceras sorbifolium]